MKEVVRQVLPTVKEFKAFWKKMGHFRYALTSREYPPILLAPEEWLFSNDVNLLLKELMQWEKQKMKAVAAPFNPNRKTTLRPENLSAWKINHFPEEWLSAVCDIFTPVGHLTCRVVPHPEEETDAPAVEKAFFACLAHEINHIGYVLLTPDTTAGDTLGRAAHIADYLREWEADEAS